MKATTENAINYISAEINRVLESPHICDDTDRGSISIRLGGFATKYISVSRATVIKLKGLLIDAAIDEEKETAQ